MPADSACKREYTAVRRVYEKYGTALITGSVDPEVYLPKLPDELDAAGIDILIQTLPSQVDAWLAQSNHA